MIDFNCLIYILLNNANINHINELHHEVHPLINLRFDITYGMTEMIFVTISPNLSYPFQSRQDFLINILYIKIVSM